MSYWDGTRWVADEVAQKARPRYARRLLGAAVEGALITALIFGLIAGSAFAAKGGGHTSGTTSTFSGPVMVTDHNGDGSPNYSDDITFSVATSAAQPVVGMRCWQGTNWVYDGYVSFFDSWLSPTFFTLDSGNWDATADASCTARLFYYDRRARERSLATPITFTVAP